MLSYHNRPGTIGSLFKRLWTLFLWKRRYIKCNTLLLWDIPHANVWRRCARKNNRRIMNKNTEESDHILDLWTRYPGTAESAVPESSSRFRLATRYFSPKEVLPPNSNWNSRTSYSARHSLSLSQICWHESHGHLSADSPHNGMTKTNILNLYWAYLFNSINLSLY